MKATEDLSEQPASVPRLEIVASKMPNKSANSSISMLETRSGNDLQRLIAMYVEKGCSQSLFQNTLPALA
jgi:hypothetical protein